MPKKETQHESQFCNDTASLFSTTYSEYSECSEQNLDTINISKWHSNKLDESSFDQSAMPYVSINYGIQRKLSSTIQEQAKMLVKHGYYNTAIDLQADCTAISNKPSFLQLPSQIEESTHDSYSISDYSGSEHFYTMGECFTSSSDRSDESTVFPSSLVTNSFNSSSDSEIDSTSSTISNDSFNALDSNYSSDIFVCILDYKPKFEGDMCIKYSDKIKFINNSNPQNNYVFVQHLKNSKYGYVPRKCLISLSQFLSL